MLFFTRKKSWKLFVGISLLIVFQFACSNEVKNNSKEINSENNMKSEKLINPEEMTLQARYGVPQGYKRVVVEKGSFAEFLRNQKLKPYGEKVQYFNGNYKQSEGIYDSVFDVEIGDRDLHQCADAIMLLRAEYFYGKKEYDKINFNFVTGFNAQYSKWMQGYRINPSGKGSYYKKSASSNTYKDFRNFMNIVFGYAGTLSLE